jgi:hypothetical protein
LRITESGGPALGKAGFFTGVPSMFDS